MPGSGVPGGGLPSAAATEAFFGEVPHSTVPPFAQPSPLDRLSSSPALGAAVGAEAAVVTEVRPDWLTYHPPSEGGGQRRSGAQQLPSLSTHVGLSAASPAPPTTPIAQHKDRPLSSASAYSRLQRSRSLDALRPLLLQNTLKHDPHSFAAKIRQASVPSALPAPKFTSKLAAPRPPLEVLTPPATAACDMVRRRRISADDMLLSSTAGPPSAGEAAASAGGSAASSHGSFAGSLPATRRLQAMDAFRAQRQATAEAGLSRARWEIGMNPMGRPAFVL